MPTVPCIPAQEAEPEAGGSDEQGAGDGKKKKNRCEQQGPDVRLMIKSVDIFFILILVPIKP